MTDEQFNNLLAFFSRNKENIFPELKHAKNERDEITRALEEMDRIIAEKDAELAEKESILAEQDAELARMDHLIREKNKALAEVDKKINDLEKRMEESKEDSYGRRRNSAKKVGGAGFEASPKIDH